MLYYTIHYILYTIYYILYTILTLYLSPTFLDEELFEGSVRNVGTRVVGNDDLGICIVPLSRVSWSFSGGIEVLSKGSWLVYVGDERSIVETTPDSQFSLRGNTFLLNSKCSLWQKMRQQLRFMHRLPTILLGDRTDMDPVERRLDCSKGHHKTHIRKLMFIPHMALLSLILKAPSCTVKITIWEFPKFRGPDIDPYIMGLLF